MQKQSKLFDDIARIITGAGNLAFDVKRELEASVARKMEVFLNKTSLVGREEFEACKQMAANARTENAALKAEIAELKQQIKD
jgi:BMFP domain-containing protein YqiC